MERKNIIYGQVSDGSGKPLAGLTVRAFDKGLRRETQLGEAVTGRDGRYEIAWSRPGTGKQAANLTIKVMTPEKHTLLYETEAEDVRFEASTQEEINAVITAVVQPEEIEYEAVLAAVSEHAGDVAITDLSEDEKHRDITHLAKAAKLSLGKVEHLVLAHRLQAISKIETFFFYALLRKNTLLRSDLTKPLHARWFIDVNADPKGVLYDAALTDEKLIERDIKQAGKDMLIKPPSAETLKRNFALLSQFKKDATAHAGEARIKTVTDIITQFVVEDKLSEAAKLFKTNKRDLSGVIKKITNVKFLGSTKKVKDLETSLALGELVGFDSSIIGQVAKAHRIKEPGDIKRLARLDKNAWKEELSKSASNIEIAGKPINKRLVNLHASSLVRKMEKEFPAEAFAAQLKREKKPAVAHHK
ncbi:MAG: carboxypeptidase-like regulatory domain-containing protein, partial [Acidobacteriota bacterium]